jgi:nucleoid-associated protein YgaU
MRTKRVAIFVLLLVSVGFLFGASYVNNEYNRLSKQYAVKAQEAFDEGEYDLSIEYSYKSKDYAEMSETYIRVMLEKAEADKQIRLAKNKKLRAEQLQGQQNFPMAFTAGETALKNALEAYGNEDYVSAASYALAAYTSFGGIKEVQPLPKYYVVRPWAESKDCYWNIAGRSYVYNNSLLWENLYQANKSSMRDPENPDLIYPGMKMLIPSISGELREGEFSTSKTYDPYTPER